MKCSGIEQLGVPSHEGLEIFVLVHLDGEVLEHAFGGQGSDRVVEEHAEVVFGSRPNEPFGCVEIVVHSLRSGNQRASNRIDHAGLVGHLDRHVAVQDFLHGRQFAVDLDERFEFGCSTVTHGRINAQADLEKVGSVSPASGAGPSDGVFAELVEGVGAEVQVGNDFFPDTVLDRVGLPGVQIVLDSEVQEAVGERGGHLVDCSPVLDTVTGRDNEPVIGNDIVSHTAVQNELHGDVLNGGGSEVDLIQEEDTPPGLGEKAGGSEVGDPFLDVGKAANISGGELAEAYVDHLHAVLFGHLLND